MKISLIIPAYNEEKYLPVCLEYVERHRTPDMLEIIVIDNASTDRTAEVARKFKNVKVVREENKGLTYARARGLLEAKGDILAYIDADTQMPSGWLETISREFEKNPRLVGLSGPYVYYDLTRFENMAVAFYWMLALPIYWILGYMMVGGNFAAKKSALIAMGGFDTTIAFYGEDTNIARRLYTQGKVKFNRHFRMYTSGRRLRKEGITKTAVTYILNYLSEALFHKQATKEYKDIR